MGELFGIPEWLAFGIFFSSFVGILGTVAWRNTKRQVRRTLAKRANPTHAEFLAMMSPDVSIRAAEFLWQSALPYLYLAGEKLTPHPDDSLPNDLPIADEDWSMDWPKDWAEQQGFHESNLPEWPDEWPATIRNYGRWLDSGPQ